MEKQGASAEKVIVLHTANLPFKTTPNPILCKQDFPNHHRKHQGAEHLEKLLCTSSGLRGKSHST